MDTSLTPKKSDLIQDLRALIEAARGKVARVVNTGQVGLYWSVGERLRREVLGGKRAAYGRQIVATVSRQLVAEYGRGFSPTGLRRMVQLVELFPDFGICATLLRKLTWSHFLLLFPIKNKVEREFYAELCRVEGWNIETLRNKINSRLYERTGMSKKPAELALHELNALRHDDVMSPDMVFQDPYCLDFLGLKGAYSEKDLEQAILRDMESFLLEFGVGFTFIERQKRIAIGGEDFHIDLLLYNRLLRRLVVVELKLGRFKAEYKGQMELYMRWLDKHERAKGEARPAGLILCSEKCEEQIELLELDKSGIRVARYMTDLLPAGVLEEKLRQALLAARRKLGTAADPGLGG
jgi:predicted nuclease of restriction endonuclease-like (RecB) superfamily